MTQRGLDLVTRERDSREALRTFRDRYAQQLETLWAGLGRLGTANPRLTSLLSRDADPRVTRLAQSAAFAAAYADLRVDNESEHLISPALARVLPDVVRPQPAATIVQLASDNSTGRTEEPGSYLESKRGQTRARFVTSWSALYAPIEITRARVVRPDPTMQVLVLTLSAIPGIAFGTALRETLRVFVSGGFAVDFIHAIRERDVHVKALNAEGRLLHELTLPHAVRWVRVDSEELPLVSSAQSSPLATGALLGDYFSFPESFAFFDIDVEALRSTPEKARRLELLISFARVVPAVEGLSARDFHLACTPAVNTFAASFARVLADGERSAVVSIADDPLAEIIDVNRVRCGPSSHAVVDVPIYEQVPPGHALLGGSFARLRRSPSVVGDRTEVELGFFSVDEPGEFLGPHIQCAVRATQRHACVDLGVGDVSRVGVSNITRVTRGLPVTWGSEVAWRQNAYARMPCAELGGRIASANAFLGLHDPLPESDAPPRVRTAMGERSQRLVRGVVQHGLHFEMEIEMASFGSVGEAWLLGELFARSLAERDDRLRYSKLTWRGHKVEFPYQARDGRLLPGVIS